MKEKNKSIIRNIIEAIVVFVLIFVFSYFNLLSNYDHTIKDKLYQTPRGVSSAIKIVAIDDKTLEELGPIGTWSRSVYADLVNILDADEAAKPSVIAFDILFQGYVDDGDYAFAEAAQKYGNVVVDCQYVYGKKPEINRDGLVTYNVETVAYPFDELRNATRVGFSNLSVDRDKIVRRLKVKEICDGEEQYMFPKVVYDLYCEQKGIAQTEVPADKYGCTLINYSGIPGDYEAISLVDVLNGEIDPRAFADSIVFVGAYANGMQDNFNVPNGKSAQMYGVEIHANIAQAFLQGRFAIPGNPILFAFIWGLLGACIHVLFKKSKVWIAAIILFAAIALECVTGVILNNKGINISLLYFPLFLVVSFVYCMAVGYVLEMIRKRQVINAFKKYVAPQVVDEISKTGKFEVNLGGEERDIAVLFVDIRGFTTMSEALEATEVVKILNEYLALTTKSIFDNSGTLDKFVGDATMAVFNSPFALEDYEYKACCAAMAIVEGGKELAPKLMEKYGRTVGFGVGVNCGKAVVGNVGCDFRMDFTAIGDTVNTSARLEANAKSGQVLISEETYERLKGRIEVTEVGPIALKGKSNTFKIYQLDKLLG